MLMPKRTKYRKTHKGRMTGKAQRGSRVTFGEYGLQSMEPGWYGFVPKAKPDSLAGMAEGFAGPRPGRKTREGDDLDVLRRLREVAVTPLSVDLTSRVDAGTLSDLLGIQRSG